ncbi:uncharacterized protein BCR38DRAFT_450437 [Pseudomassariella vexata]|uniref:Uncharacterized protein n=1 Tax=Pseudomassariella vexata TaxID=1141098 RepID=A0A1Y2DCQ2_9PEZI|nr:uncharacterized protein BCR38DRAFT_450437 [Pseudomassariella vexata]ORY56957.1 hypothetical protein BCR38DRAFT_450437 [Pseudomassariella vexata]
MFPTLMRTAGASPIPPQLRKPMTGVYNSRFKPKKIWPPDFSKLTQKEQFRFERKYKRRVKLATARPRWDKYVKMAQLFSITSVVIYTILFMDWNTDPQPFQAVRSRFWSAVEAFSPTKRYERRKSE